MRKSALEMMLKSIAALHKVIAKTKGTLEPMLLETVLPAFGMYLTYTGLAEITGGEVSAAKLIELDRLRGDDRFGRNVYSAHQLDQHTANDRAGIAQSVGMELFSGLLLQLETPLRDMLKIETVHKGGRPQDEDHNYVIQELGRVYPEIFGKPATTTVTGQFLTLCSDVLQALGLEERDLKNIVPRVLKNAGLMPGSKTKAPPKRNRPT